MPVCFDCALDIAEFVENVKRWNDEDPEYGPVLPPAPEPQSYVYYLILSPTTVKIGTTRHLERRIRSLRSELQYVVALEVGGIELEHERHREFADERRNIRREDFHLSDRLKRHIGKLAADRDDLIRAATDSAVY